jgi:hypothetical protein
MELGRLANDETEAIEDAVRKPASHEARSSAGPVPLLLPPKTVKPVPRLAGDLDVLGALLAKDKPTQTVLRAARVYIILYGFADASGSRFRSTILGEDGISYWISTWDSDTKESSSNFREFENVVEALKEEARKGHMCPDFLMHG